MKIYFTGSDVQLLNEFPKQLPAKKLPYVLYYREFIWASKHFAEEYFVVHEHLIPELRRFGIKGNISVLQHPVLHTEKYIKKPHGSFNILYYCPESKDKEWNEWIYGYDIFVRLKQYYKGTEVRFIESWGQLDMKEIYPITDFYIRCNRHDGGGRMVDECKIQDIPYYWSWENPDFNEIIKQINARR